VFWFWALSDGTGYEYAGEPQILEETTSYEGRWRKVRNWGQDISLVTYILFSGLNFVLEFSLYPQA
jgi:hypothetical protein